MVGTCLVDCSVHKTSICAAQWVLAKWELTFRTIPVSPSFRPVIVLAPSVPKPMTLEICT